jgi:hypothetical protein
MEKAPIWRLPAAPGSSCRADRMLIIERETILDLEVQDATIRMNESAYIMLFPYHFSPDRAYLFKA